MKTFPKKYKPENLSVRAKKYRENINNKIESEIWNSIFSLWFLSIWQKISYKDFLLIYTRDFFNYISNQNSKDKYQQLFITSTNQLQNIYKSYEFFDKKNQTLFQVWANKFRKYLISKAKKNLNANNKIIESYVSSQYKIYMPDSELYLYIIKQLHKLRDNWIIKNESKIWYWSFKLQSSISAHHITWREEKRKYFILKYFVWAKCEALPVYIEDIDLCCWDVALLVHPKDKRYNKFIWKNAIIPLCNRQIPIIWDENVNIALNNWIQRVCPCSDQESIYLAEKYWLPTDIYVFDKEWKYTEYIHEKAFIWEERSKYYNNIEWFIEDIWNLEEKGEKIIKVPYIDYLNERLVPYKIEQIIVNLNQIKQKILDKIFSHQIRFSFLDDECWEIFKKIELLYSDLKNNEDNNDEIELENSEIKNNIEQLKKNIEDEIDKYIPEYFVCNSQMEFGRKMPLIKWIDWNISFFDVEKEIETWDKKPLQFCFDFVLLSLLRAWIIWKKNWDNEYFKIWEINKFLKILSENEKKIEYFVKYLSDIKWNKSEYDQFLKIVQNITDEQNSSSSDLIKLIKDSEYIEEEWNQLFLKISWLLDDTIDPDFIQLCVLSYLKSKGININNKVIYNREDKLQIFQELLVEEILLWDNIIDNFEEIVYDKSNEFLWDKQLSKLQLEQNQRNLFQQYGENPIRLNFLVNQSYNQKEILLNNIFLKQIWNATRLCIQNNFIPKDIEKCLENQPEEFEDFDISVLEKLNELYNDWLNIKDYEQYIKFFTKFKESIQNFFFSRYLEIQKISPTKDVQFVCSYFFNFLLTILYPLIPEYVDALQYISERNFIKPLKHITLNKTWNYDMNVLYNTFVKIKQIKIEYNIKQHESCNIFIKSTPTIGDIFEKNEQIFKNYFHISDIIYLRLHENNPLWYEIFTDDTITIWIQSWMTDNITEKESLENIEKDLKNLEDKLNLLRQRLQILPEWEQRTKTEQEYAQTKEEMEDLTIKYSLLISSK